MKRKVCSLSLIIYEVKNVCGNPFTIFFSTAFPILMLFLLSKTYMQQIPEVVRDGAVSQLFITMSMVVPMSIFLIGHGANYSQELEKDIPLRMNLFGFTHASMMLAKMIANFLFLTAAFILYAVAGCLLVEVQAPAGRSAAIFIITIYVLAAVFFVMSHAIATLVKRFGPTYAITMMLYFIFLILCGMMGMSTESFPKGIRRIADMLPMTYVSQEFGGFWQGGSYNFAPFFQSLLFLGAVAGILLFWGLHKEKRIIK